MNRGPCDVMVIVVRNGQEFKSLTRMLAYHIALIRLGKVNIQLLSIIFPPADSRADLAL